MGSLTTCLQKAGKAISAENKAAVIDHARALREEGKDATAAALQAVDEQIAAVEGRLAPEQAEKPTVYPLAPAGTRYEESDKPVTMMSPDAYLAAVRPLEIDDASRDNIDDLKAHILAGKPLDPLHIRVDGKEDGRHRAVAARELGIKEVPVIDERMKSKPGTVENFGEALPPSRRQRQAALDADLSDDDIASKPLSEIWPLAENDAIEDTFAAAVAHAARAAVPAKPRKGYKLDRWVDSVKTVRQLAQFITSGQYTREQFIAKVPKTYALQHFMSKVALLEAVDRKHWKRIGAVEQFPESYNYEDGKKIPSPQVSVTIDGKHHWLRGSGSVADHIEAISGLLGDAAPDKRMEFEVRGSGTSYGINKKGDSEYRRLMEFPTAAEALKARNEKYDELVAAWEAVKERDNVTERDLRSAENKDRVGPDYRKGRDISGDEFDATFGFRGGEFGKWVSQGKGDKERQWMLNRAYDALMDLAGIVGVPPRAISLNGTLGIAFGSRGTGWASAHFEPSNLVINLTKTRGAGALAHEWFHALDNYFARARGGEVAFTGDQLGYRKDNYVTYKPEPMMVGKGPGFRGPMRKAELERRRAQNPESRYYLPEHWQVDPKHPEGVRPVVEERFAALVEALDAAPMTKRARMIDDSAEGYWSRIIERAARSFESYVIHRMMEKGQSNEYLANVTKFQDFKRDKGRYPYPTPDEIKPVAEAFDALFATLETRTDEAGNVALQNIARTQTQTPEFKRWFGDSKVVDAKGEPLVVYHGTKAEFTEFKRTKSGEFGPAIYLTDSPREAGEYGDGKGWGGPSGTAVMPVYVSIKNPYTKGVDAFWQEFGASDSDAAALERAQAAGFDGIIAKRADRYYDNDTREFVDRGDVLTHYIAFRPEQIKSAIGNSGAFDPANPSIVANLSRVGETIGRMGYERQDTPRIQAARKLTGLVKRLEEGKITSGHFELAVRLLAGEMDRVVLTKAANRLMTERERGPDIVREKLIAGRRRGELDSDMVDFALWALEQNPSLAANLGITVMAQKEGATGDYNPTSEIMRVFKYAADTDTAVHEILHHAERMMPADMQAAIRKEWAAALAATIKRSTPEQVKALEAISGALVGDKASYKALVKAIQEGPLNYDEHYQLVNPSEFFAVNGSRLLGKDFAAKDSVWARIKVWLSGMVEKIKAILGLRSDAPILKALAYVMDRENFGPERGGRFESGVMLSDVNTIMASGVLNQISGEPTGPWYSALSRAVNSNPMNAGPASAWKAAFKNWVSTGKAKADELAWTGLEDWIELQTGKVTKAQVQAYLDANGVQVSETVLGDREPIQPYQVVETANGWNIESGGQTLYPEDFDTYGEAADRANELQDNDDSIAAENAGRETKYGNYTLPGGTNYREVLLTLPVPMKWASYDSAGRLKAWLDGEPTQTMNDAAAIAGGYLQRTPLTDAAGTYKSGHWDTPSVLAHIRVNDRTDATGARVLFVEEIQSDWGAETRKQREAIAKTVDADFSNIVERMKKAGVLEVNCD